MPDRRPWRLDLTAFGLLLIGLLTALSVFSNDPASPDNLLGPMGEEMARGLDETMGVAVYVLLAGWFTLVLLLFLRHQFLTWSLRLFGWLLLIPSTALTAELFVLHGSGGNLGTFLAGWLQENFYPIGRGVIQGASCLLGLILALDYLLFTIARTAARFALGSLQYSRQSLSRILTRDKRTGPPSRKQTADPSEMIPVTISNAPTSEESSTGESLIPIRHANEMVEEGAHDAVIPINRPGPTSEAERFADFELPPMTLLEDAQPFPYQEHDQRLRDVATLLEKTFKDFDLNVRVVGINTGPVITQYEVALETGLRVNKVTNMGDDLALNLKAPSVRIVAPIPGKNTVGIEVPNEHRAVVRLKEVILATGKKVAKMKIPLFLGKDTEGRPLVYDLAEMPHLLIAGRTGTGKSVAMNSIILSMLMTRRPDEVKMIMIDPKQLEMSEYSRIPHLMHPVVKDMKKAEAILSWAVDKMEERYDLLSRVRVRNIAGYNELAPEEIRRRLGEDNAEEPANLPERMPYIVIFIDEMADLIVQMRKEVETHIIRLAAKSRAAGIHLVVATQKPTVDVITGLIKSNLPARICFQVSSRTDSRVVLDEMGADKLLGKGDMLFLQPGTSNLARAQGTYASDDEIHKVVEHLECDPCYAEELIKLNTAKHDGSGNLLERLRSRDELYEQAIEVLVREGRGSVSLLQRALGIGYGRAARLIDYMAEDGIVGEYNGSQAREVLFSPERWEEVKQSGRMAS